MWDDVIMELKEKIFMEHVFCQFAIQNKDLCQDYDNFLDYNTQQCLLKNYINVGLVWKYIKIHI